MLGTSGRNAVHAAVNRLVRFPAVVVVPVFKRVSLSFVSSYADQAKRIMNVAVVNEDKNTKLIDALKFEVEELRRQLAEKEGMLGLGPAKPITVVERVEVEVGSLDVELLRCCR